jgi:serine/threonine protein kinase
MGTLTMGGIHFRSASAARGFRPVGEVESDPSGVLIAARSEASGALVDVRILAPALKADRALMRRVRADMDALREVRHTNLVSVMYFDKRVGAVVYESVKGSTLRQLLAAHWALELAASLVLLEDIVSGLEALHNAGILHRNLTPDAVVVETTGAVLLRDAGLSLPPAAPGLSLPPSAAGLLAGQGSYSAPEVLAGSAPTSASDLYAAVAVFVDSIGGRASKTAVRTDLRSLLAEGMATDPSKRSASLDTFRGELDDYARATIGETWRKDGRAQLITAAAAQASRAIRVSSPSDPARDGTDDSAAAIALLRSPGPRDPRITWGLGVLAFAALLAIVVLVRGLTGNVGPATGPLGPLINAIPFYAQGTPTPSPTAISVAPATSAGTATPGTVVPNPIIPPSANPTSGSRPSGPTLLPTPPPNPKLQSQSISWRSSKPSGAAYGGTYVASAIGGASGNPVVFFSVNSGVCRPIASNAFQYVSVGTCEIEATQSGNSRYNPATPSAMIFNVGPATQVIAFTSSPSNPTYLGSYTVTASAKGGAVTFTADASSSACSVTPTGAVTFTAAGDCFIDANQAGNADYLPAPQIQQPILVAKATQTVTMTSNPPCNPCAIQTQYTLSGTATSGLAVTFGIDSSSTPGSCTIAGNVVTINAGLGFPGNCVIDWYQNGDQNYSAAPDQSQTIGVL